MRLAASRTAIRNLAAVDPHLRAGGVGEAKRDGVAEHRSDGAHQHLVLGRTPQRDDHRAALARVANNHGAVRRVCVGRGDEHREAVGLDVRQREARVGREALREHDETPIPGCRLWRGEPRCARLIPRRLAAPGAEQPGQVARMGVRAADSRGDHSANPAQVRQLLRYIERFSQRVRETRLALPEYGQACRPARGHATYSLVLAPTAAP